MPARKPPKSSNYSQGLYGEDFAVELLLEKNYKILDRNFRSKTGEIDIIAKDGDELVFVEVKARWGKKYGAPEEAVTLWKLNKIRRVIDYYNLINKNLPKKQRIDVVSILIEDGKVVTSKIIKVV